MIENDPKSLHRPHIPCLFKDACPSLAAEAGSSPSFPTSPWLPGSWGITLLCTPPRFCSSSAPLAKSASALPVRPAPLEGRVCHIEALPLFLLQTPGLNSYFLLTASFVVAVHSYLSSASIERNIDALPSSLETPDCCEVEGFWGKATVHETLSEITPLIHSLPLLACCPSSFIHLPWEQVLHEPIAYKHLSQELLLGGTHPMTDSKALFLIPMLYFQKSLALSLHRVPI